MGKPLTKDELIADLVTHAGYKVLMEDIFEFLIKEEEERLWNSTQGPQARVYQLEVVTYMKAFLSKAKTKIANTVVNAQQKGQRDVQKTQRTGRR